MKHVRQEHLEKTEMSVFFRTWLFQLEVCGDVDGKS